MDENISPTPMNEAMLQDLVLRLAIFPGDPRVENPQLLIGQLPQALPFELPLPERSRVLGTLVRSMEHVDIVLDSSLSPEEVLNFYKERMQAAGWQLLDFPARLRQGGFAHEAMLRASSQIIFCQGPRGPALTLYAFVGKKGLTDVRLNLNLSKQSPCMQLAQLNRQPLGIGMHTLIPILMPPTGTRQMPQGGGGGFDAAYSAATLETDSDLLTLSSHYIAQLEKAGWTRSDEGHDERLAWNTWTFQDENNEQYRGMFFVLKTSSTTGQYFLFVRIEQANGGGMTGLSGWYSSAPMIGL
jgi:hypothetical protein